MSVFNIISCYVACFVRRFITNIVTVVLAVFFFFQAEDGIRDLVRSRGLGDVYKRQVLDVVAPPINNGMVNFLFSIS